MSEREGGLLLEGSGSGGWIGVRQGQIRTPAKMLYDSIDGLVVLDHLLVVAAALLMGARPQKLAHNSVEVPLTTLLLLPLYHLPKLDQEINVFSILILRPVRSRILLLCWREVIEAVNHLLGPEHPRLELTQLPTQTTTTTTLLRMLLARSVATLAHGAFNNIIKPENIIKNLRQFKNYRSGTLLTAAVHLLASSAAEKDRF